MTNIKDSFLRVARTKFVRDTAILQVGTFINMGATVLTSILVFRGLEPEGYGAYRLAVALYGTLTALDLTGLGPSTSVRLSAALARGDAEAARDLMAYYVKVSALVALAGLLLIGVLGPLTANILYGAPTVGELARLLALLLVLEPVHTLVEQALQCSRRMARFTLINTLLALMHLSLIGAAVLGGHGAAGVIAARVVSAALMGAFAAAYYAYLRTGLHPSLPTWGAVLRRAPSVAIRPYIGFGFGIALDKNVASLFTLLPLQLLGSLHGETVAGYIGLAQSAITMPSSIFNAAMHNLGVRLPHDVGRGDYGALRRNFARVTGVLAAGGVVTFGLFTLIAPWLLPFLYGEEAVPVVPLIAVMSLYGAVAAAGGSMGALYRALQQVPKALIGKVATLAAMAVPGYLLIREYAALGTAWTLTLLIGVSVSITAALVVPYLNRLVREQAQSRTSVAPAGPSQKGAHERD